MDDLVKLEMKFIFTEEEKGGFLSLFFNNGDSRALINEQLHCFCSKTHELHYVARSGNGRNQLFPTLTVTRAWIGGCRSRDKRVLWHATLPLHTPLPLHLRYSRDERCAA
jgi:hypothetical protein